MKTSEREHIYFFILICFWMRARSSRLAFPLECVPNLFLTNLSALLSLLIFNNSSARFSYGAKPATSCTTYRVSLTLLLRCPFLHATFFFGFNAFTLCPLLRPTAISPEDMIGWFDWLVGCVDGCCE